jgi:hypothetical protein
VNRQPSRLVHGDQALVTEKNGQGGGHGRKTSRCERDSRAAMTAALRGLDSKIGQRVSRGQKIRDPQHLEIP